MEFNSGFKGLMKLSVNEIFFVLWRCDPTRVMASSFLMFLDHTQRRTTVGRTPLDEWSDRRTDLYLTTHNTHNRQTSMPPVGFEPTISASQRPQTARLRPRGNEIIYCLMIRYFMDNELDRMWRKATVPSFKVIFLHLPGKPPGFSIIDPRF